MDAEPIAERLRGAIVGTDAGHEATGAVGLPHVDDRPGAEQECYFLAAPVVAGGQHPPEGVGRVPARRMVQQVGGGGGDDPAVAVDSGEAKTGNHLAAHERPRHRHDVTGEAERRHVGHELARRLGIERADREIVWQRVVGERAAARHQRFVAAAEVLVPIGRQAARAELGEEPLGAGLGKEVAAGGALQAGERGEHIGDVIAMLARGHEAAVIGEARVVPEQPPELAAAPHQCHLAGATEILVAG